MEKLLEIRSLSVDFRTPRGRVRALREVSMVVPKGKIIGVVGESGSGKSTLIWTIMRLLAVNGTVENGEILFDGGNVLEFDDNRLKGFRGEQVSMVFQDPMTSQSPVLDYRSQFTDILYRRTEMSRRERLGKAIKMMNRVGIPDSEKRIYQYPHHFSGGMRQRAGIAMALLMDPSLLIADEPTTALDVTMEAQIIHLIREARSEFGSTVMLVSHNLGLIAELCDEIVVMYAGEIVEHADAHDIFFDAKHPYTKALIACNPALDLEMEGQFPTIPGDVPDLHQSPAGCVFAPRCAFSDETCLKERPANSISAGKHSEVVDHSVRCHLYCPDKGGKTKRDLTALSLNAAADRTRSEIAHRDEADELLSIQDLRVRFPTMGRIKALAEGVDDLFIDAVYEVSLGLRAGETLGLVGESGSGKTTLGRAIIGLNRVHSGSIKFKGSELVGLSQNQYRKVRRDVAMMFQDPVGSLSPRRTVGQLLTEPFLIHGIEKGSQRDQAARLCEMVSLPVNFLSRYPHELSGGQARRVGVARALALNPALIVADEPTAGLDVSVQGEILNLMLDMQAAHGLGFLLISHNLPVIRHVCDKLAIMYLGRIVEYGDCEQVFRNPAHPYSQALVRGTPQPDPTRRRQLVSIEGEVPSLSNRPGGCEFHTRCPYSGERCKNLVPEPSLLANGRTVRCHNPLAE